MTYRVVQSDHPLHALGRDVDANDNGIGDCQPTYVMVFAGISKTDGFGDVTIELKDLWCNPTPPPAEVVSFVATVLDRNGEPTQGKPTPMITWYPLPGPRVRVRSVDAWSNKIPEVEFGWQAVVELVKVAS
jgi:hypothetical protein